MMKGGYKMIMDYPYQKYMGFRYAITPNRAGILCAYIRIPKTHKLYEKDYSTIDWPEELDSYTSGGFTFSGDRPFGDKDDWWLGWDYGHSFNYDRPPVSYADVEKDCFEVIKTFLLRVEYE